MKNRFAKLIDVKSIVTIMMALCMVLLLTGVFNPPKEILTLFSTTFGAVITYFFTKKPNKESGEM